MSEITLHRVYAKSPASAASRKARDHPHPKPFGVKGQDEGPMQCGFRAGGGGRRRTMDKVSPAFFTGKITGIILTEKICHHPLD